jgi:hypothetical protein
VYTRVGMHTLKGLKEGKCHKRMHLLLHLGYLRYVFNCMTMKRYCITVERAGACVVSAAACNVCTVYTVQIFNERVTHTICYDVMMLTV